MVEFFPLDGKWQLSNDENSIYIDDQTNNR